MTNSADLLAEKLSRVEFGIYPDISNERYHKGAGISKSDLDRIHRSPAHFLASLKAPEETNEAFIVGTAFHTAVLEPERFAKEYTALPYFNRRTKVGKEDLEAWQKEHEGMIVLPDETMDMVRYMRDSVLRNPIARRLVELTQHELSVYAEIDGITCKCRPDGWSQSESIMFDLKSARDASPDAFARSVANCRYHVQEAWYKTVTNALGEKVDAYYFVVCEKEPPYAVALYQLDPLSVEVGHHTAMADFETFRRAVETMKFEGYPKTIQTLSLPRWAITE